MAYPDAPHFQHPFTRSGTAVVVVEQGSTEHIASQELNVIACPVGWRTERPEYGWPMPLFKTAPLDPAPLENALNQFVPDSNATAVEYADQIDASIRHMSVNAEVDQGADRG